jgi:hypothetical protein
MSQVAQHAYSHIVRCDDGELKVTAGIGKTRKSAHTEFLTNPISQPSLDIPPIWIPFISNEVSN